MSTTSFFRCYIGQSHLGAIVAQVSTDSSNCSPGPTLTSMVRIRPDMVSMWSRLVVSNTVPLAGRAVACGLKPLDPDNVWTPESMYAPHRDVLPGMNAGASPYAVPSPIEGSGTA